MSRQPKILAFAVLLSFAPLAAAEGTPGTPGTNTTPTTTTRTSSVPANRLADLFAKFFGSRENSLAVVNALRTGSAITLVTTPPCPAPCTKPPAGVETSIDVATKPMGWGNVRHALALTQYSLAQAGITNPTPEQIAAALNGGTVKTGTGKTVELNGILTQRASGMGWGQIAKAEGTTMGKVNHFKVATVPPTATTASAPGAPRNALTASAAPSYGVSTAADGGSAKLSQPGRGIVTGNGGGVATGVASGNGHGKATVGGNGNGNGAGHGQSAGVGVTTATNAAASTTITTAQAGGSGNGNGKGNGNANGNGKGGK